MTDLTNLLNGFKSGSRRSLAQVITIVESTLVNDQRLSKEILKHLSDSPKDALRLGITGSPGVGKSTVIENLGLLYIEKGFNVCVLAVDPSSPRSGGSILGDKTRMPGLTNSRNAYVRPSPTGMAQGGVADRTQDVVRVCEAFGFDYIIVETVGVGQTELAVAAMVDVLILMLLPHAGDELQGIKKGVMECADIVLVNKEDVDATGAQKLLSQCKSALKLFRPKWDYWEVPVIKGSSTDRRTLETLMSEVEKFTDTLQARGKWSQRRQEQDLSWLRQEIKRRLLESSLYNKKFIKQIQSLESDYLNSTKSFEEVMKEILGIFNLDKF